MFPRLLSPFSTVIKRNRLFSRTSMERIEHPGEHQHHVHHHLHHLSFFPKRVTVKRSAKYHFNGRASYLYAIRKFNIQPPSAGMVFFTEDKRLAVRGHQKGQAGMLPTSDIQNDSMYLCPVTIGEGKQAVTVNLDFDTGSADLWGNLAHSEQEGHTIYDPTKSSTAKHVDGATWKIAYGDGSSASGDVYTDTVTLGGLVIKNQAVECAKKVSSDFASGQGDGLLGLAFSLINTVTPQENAITPVQMMNTEGVTPAGHEMFTCKLTRHTEAPGYYTFGYIDQADLGNTPPFYVPIIDDSGFWKVNSVSAVVDGTVIHRTGNTGICDTGTTLLLVDSALCKAVYAKVPGAKFDSASEGWIFPSSVKESEFPTIEIGIGTAGNEHRFSIYPGDLNFSEASPGWIYGGIQDRGDQGFDILGDIFLKNVYAIWDVKGKRFGAVQRPYNP